MMRHLDGSWNAATAAVLGALETQHGDRVPIALVVAELVRDPAGGTAWLVQHALASRLAVTPSAVLRELARMLELAADRQDDALQ